MRVQGPLYTCNASLHCRILAVLHQPCIHKSQNNIPNSEWKDLRHLLNKIRPQEPNQVLNLRGKLPRCSRPLEKLCKLLYLGADGSSSPENCLDAILAPILVIGSAFWRVVLQSSYTETASMVLGFRENKS